jgi:hypothetical protein
VVAHCCQYECGSADGRSQSNGFQFTVVPEGIVMALEGLDCFGECIRLQQILVALEDIDKFASGAKSSGEWSPPVRSYPFHSSGLGTTRTVISRMFGDYRGTS